MSVDTIADTDAEAAATLVARAKTGGQADALALRCWASQSLARQHLVARIEQGWDAVELLQDTPEMRGWMAAARRSRSPRVTVSHLALAASLACVLMSGAIGWTQLSTPAPASARMRIATDIGAVRTVVLADGSRVTLDRAAHLRVRFTRHERRIELDGQARFAVAHDADRPFYVRADGWEVRATGTQFIVDAGGARFATSLIEGAVIVSRLDARRSWLGFGAQAQPTDAVALTPGRQLVEGPDGSAILRRFDSAEVSAWERGQLVFDSEPLGSVAERLNRYSRKRLVIEGASLRAERLSGVFAVGNLESFVETVTEIFPGTSATRQGDRIIIAPARPAPAD